MNVYDLLCRDGGRFGVRMEENNHLISMSLCARIVHEGNSRQYTKGCCLCERN